MYAPRRSSTSVLVTRQPLEWWRSSVVRQPEQMPVLWSLTRIHLSQLIKSYHLIGKRSTLRKKCYQSRDVLDHSSSNRISKRRRRRESRPSRMHNLNKLLVPSMQSLSLKETLCRRNRPSWLDQSSMPRLLKSSAGYASMVKSWLCSPLIKALTSAAPCSSHFML